MVSIYKTWLIVGCWFCYVDCRQQNKTNSRSKNSVKDKESIRRKRQSTGLVYRSLCFQNIEPWDAGQANSQPASGSGSGSCSCSSHPKVYRTSGKQYTKNFAPNTPNTMMPCGMSPALPWSDPFSKPHRSRRLRTTV